MNNNFKLHALVTGLVLSAPITHAANDYSDYFAYDVSGVQVKETATTQPQQTVSEAELPGYQDEIIFLDTAETRNSSGNTGEIIYESEPAATTTTAQQLEIIYDNAQVAETTPPAQTEIAYTAATTQRATPAPGGSSYAMYADTSDPQQELMPAPDTQGTTLALQPAQPQAIPVSRHEIEQAISAGRVDLAEALHKRGADFLSPGHQGITYLHKAAAAGKLNLVKYLVKIGASPNAKTTKDWTPLHHAARFGHADVATYLLTAGADKHQKTSDGFSPAQLAVNVQQMQVAGLLQ